MSEASDETNKLLASGAAQVTSRKHVKLIWRLLGILLAGIGILVPLHWFDPALVDPTMPPPFIHGGILLKICLVLAGFASWILASGWFKIKTPSSQDKLALAGPDDSSDPLSAGRAMLVLAAITVTGLMLRLFHMDSSLWLDEVGPVLRYGNLSFLQVLSTYLGSNNHLLNTWLVNFSVSLFGPQEWAIRLPAVLFGAASVPALYWLARLAFSRTASLVAAFLLCVSYHHIFFSQNSRGYSAYIFFSLAASRLLADGLRGGRGRVWVLYALAMALNFAALLHSVFVLLAHMTIGGVAILLVWWKGGSPRPLLMQLAAVFSGTAILFGLCYAAVLPQAWSVMNHLYTAPSSGFGSPLSSGFLEEVQRGLSAGLANGLSFVLALIGLAAVAGFVGLLRRNWMVTLSILLPNLLLATLAVLKNLTVTPRFFILGLPLAILAILDLMERVTVILCRTLRRAPAFALWLQAALAALIGLICLMPLRTYYAIPKQDFKGSIQYVQSMRKPGDVVIVVHLAEYGYRFYAREMGKDVEDSLRYVRSVDLFDQIVSENSDRRILLVTTFHRALQLELPELFERIERRWKPERDFPGTIGDGKLTIWTPQMP